MSEGGGEYQSGEEASTGMLGDGAVTVAIIHAQPLICDALGALVERELDFEVLARIDDHRHAVEVVARLVPAVLVVDVDLPGTTCVELIAELRRQQPAVGIVALAQGVDMEQVQSVMSAGATGYVFAGARSQSLFVAMRAAVRNERYLCARAVDAVVGSWTRDPTAASEMEERSNLSPREEEVCRLLVQWRSVKEVGTILAISPKTVETHRKHLMKKLGVDGVAELVRYAIRSGMVSLEDG
jgi:DNA-binding NarL/FixJ family response regulator